MQAGTRRSEPVVFVDGAVVLQGGSIYIYSHDHPSMGQFLSVDITANCCSAVGNGPHSTKSAAAVAGMRLASSAAERTGMGCWLAK